MNSNRPITVSDTENGRYSTFAFIDWWRQEVVRSATVLVAGVGALGNEVVKNLALIGIGNLIIVDFDVVEYSNLTRSVLFRETDRGHPKAEVAAARVKDLNPEVGVRWFHGNIARTLGLGVYRYADVVIGCLDNREARLTVNRACWKVDRPWIDGGMQELVGEMRLFWPQRGACYECTMTKIDYQMMNQRYSCTSLACDAVQTGTIPTTPTGSSIIAGLQTQEALKILHGMEVETSKAVVFNGFSNTMYTVQYECSDHCISHVTFDPIHICPELQASTTTLHEMLQYVRGRLGKDARIELDLSCWSLSNAPMIIP